MTCRVESLAFALGMTIAMGIKAPLNHSVFSASAGAFVLACCAERGTRSHDTRSEVRRAVLEPR